jgi:replicative DNA helicase
MTQSNFNNKFDEQIARGEKGLNTGIPFKGFTTLSDYICNVQQGRMDTIFAETGSGKSSFVNSAYVFGAIQFILDNPDYIHNLEVIHYSLELKPEAQMAKYAASRIWDEHQILTSVNEIFSKGNFDIRPEVKKLLPHYQAELNQIVGKHLHFRNSLNVKYFYKDILSYAEKRGQVIKNSKGIILDYKPKDPSLITLIIIDHAALINHTGFSNLKEAIDELMKMCIFFRNIFNFSPVIVSQVNRSSTQMERLGDSQHWKLKLSDIKHTGDIADASDTVIAVNNPFRNKINTCNGFDITKYKDRFRLASILKNRDGAGNKEAPMLFVGECGNFYQLPSAKELEGAMPEELKRVKEYYKGLNK